MHERVGGAIERRGAAVDADRGAGRRLGGVDADASSRPTGRTSCPGMLAPLEVRDGVGVHVEPNVWLRHRV